ncbi:hypothetical protein DFJ58DRAFT_872054 [Suillus subalutaceus]|uniref:uncharacterized protein n=1 Tax=Suillus subalutaceus TaxID=48586 RepID=UPI001B87E7DA|nr:uncharacterized protein DFJ58DRAFT_872054 [Suillus subalutaceus]KAG1831448.1 hypothetical protein DFJ58DRAFT_872054 [Suillus subalutaceus]
MPPTNRRQRGHVPPEERQCDNIQAPSPSPAPSSEPEDARPVLIPYQTEPDTMGLYRVWGERYLRAFIQDFLHQKLPPTSFLKHLRTLRQGILMAWQYTGMNEKSGAEWDCLVHFLKDPLLRLEDLGSLNHTRELKRLDEYLKNKANPFREEYGWRQSTVKIRLPKEKEKFKSENDVPELEIPGVSKTFNMTPFQQYWKTPDNRDIKVFSESYSSPAMLEAYAEINALPHEPGDKLEHVVALVMVWSDATHLANFGDVSLWPFYVYFGNQSKYTRGKPTARACHHLAYIPTLPKNIQEIYMDIFDKPTTASMHTHLK